MGQEGIQRIVLGCQFSLYMIYGVNQPCIHLYLAPPNDTHRAGHTDTTLVVAIHIRAHR